MFINVLGSVVFFCFVLSIAYLSCHKPFHGNRKEKKRRRILLPLLILFFGCGEDIYTEDFQYNINREEYKFTYNLKYIGKEDIHIYEISVIIDNKYEVPFLIDDKYENCALKPTTYFHKVLRHNDYLTFSIILCEKNLPCSEKSKYIMKLSVNEILTEKTEEYQFVYNCL